MTTFSKLRASAALAVLAVLSATASATTWTVDDDGPADFSDLPAAVAGALPGDVLLVAPGVYSSFTLSYGLTIVGSGAGGASLTRVLAPGASIQALPPGRRVLFTKMLLHGLTVTACSSRVIIDAASVIDTRVENSTDVRFRACSLGGLPSSPGGIPAGTALEVVASRVEVTSSTVSGGGGHHGGFSQAGAGGIAIHCTQAGVVHVSGSDVNGGLGGYADCDSGFPAIGGYGIVVSGPGSRLLATGVAGDRFFAGLGGCSFCFGCSPELAPLRVEMSGYARISGITLAGEFGNDPNYYETDSGGVVERASPDDPSLVTLGTQAPGDTVTFVLRGPPGASARLRLGRSPAVTDVPGAYEDRLIAPLRTYSLGGIPPSGEVQFPIALSPFAAPGSLIMAQASITTDLGTELTQSVPLVVR